MNGKLCCWFLFLLLLLYHASFIVENQVRIFSDSDTIIEKEEKLFQQTTSVSTNTSSTSNELNEPIHSIATVTASSSSTIIANNNNATTNASTSEKKDKLIMELMHRKALKQKETERQKKGLSVSLDLSDTIVLHLGKAGGGTLLSRKKFWKINEKKWCHPYPCSNDWVNKRRIRTIIVTLRDPVDRFYSAFNWRALVVCRPEGIETRIRATWIKNNPAKYCKPIPFEYNLLHETFHNDANELAEALCDTNKARELQDDIKKVQHLGHFLADWIPATTAATPLLAPSQQFVALVLEPGIITGDDYSYQMDAVLKYAVSRSQGGTYAETAIDRYEYARENAKRDELRQQISEQAKLEKQMLKNNVTSSSNNKQVVHYHSSQGFQDIYPNRTKLSPLATCCVARFLQKDYEILHMLKTMACWGDEATTCQQAIHSIQQRREIFFQKNNNNMDMSCHDLVSREIKM